MSLNISKTYLTIEPYFHTTPSTLQNRQFTEIMMTQFKDPLTLTSPLRQFQYGGVD